MKLITIGIPGLALGGALMLVNPGIDAVAFSTNGDSLGPGQRDFRVFNNFADAQANNNTVIEPWFPGWDGAELAIWKGCVEWGSVSHGNGSGDPSQGNIGDGGANFDGAWMGNAAASGSTDHNVMSAISSCTSGVLGFAEPPYSNGWRIRFCDDQWVWDDGPGSPQFRQDIQGVATHEYGHALGLGHSGVGQATMFASTSGGTAPRSIHSDDSAGVQAVYGVAEATKPQICETSVSGSTITIKGVRFDPVDNDVWFCNSAVTLANLAEPRIRVLTVPSTNNGTEITVTIPAGAGSGDVLVKTSDTGGKSLSNAFPANLAGGTLSVPCPFAVASISPSTMDPIDPGTAESVTLTGFELGTVTQIDLNGNVVPSSRWTAVNGTTITIDMPLGLLGSNTLNVTDGDTTSSINFTVVQPAAPLLELGTGDAGNPIANGNSMNIVVAGNVGAKHQIYYSTFNTVSNHPAVCFDIGANFTSLFFGAVFTVGPNAYTQFSAPVTFGGGSPVLFYSQSVDTTTAPAPKFGVSNVQSVTLTP